MSAFPIRLASPADSPAIAALHRREIPWGLLSHLGPDVVAAFYDALIRSRLGFAFVAEQDGQVVGFASGVVDWRRFSRAFLRAHPGAVARAAIAAVRSRRAGRLAETTRYVAAPDLPAAELVAIALDPAARGEGVGASLVRRVLEEFGARGVAKVRVTAGGENARARRLYERMGFRLLAETAIHRGEVAPVYVRDLRAPTGGG